jgi:S1-C subfamily serine protease
VYQVALNLTQTLNGMKELHFKQSDLPGASQSRRFSVTLGVIPDHAWEGKGMRIDAVTKEKTADKAGLLKGDIVIRIDETEVIDIMTYMKALSGYKKGDKAKITYLRGQIENTVEVVF